jgi:hypothetical protein
MIKFQTQFETAGDGYWSDVAKTVNTTGIAVPYVNDEEDFGELRVYFDKQWDVRKDGLIYTDSLFLVMLREKLAECGFDATDVDYSEQGMQGDNYVSLDVGKKFLQSWFNVVDKVLD